LTGKRLAPLPKLSKLELLTMEQFWAAAIREQVGLTLEPATLPTDVLVIDRMARP
jgi:uncharacterized protein (TIGR03435 family)